MSKRFSVHLAEPALAALGIDPDQGLSGRITETALRHRALLDDAMPTLTEAQWCALCDVLNGFYMRCESTDPGADPVRHAWFNLVDATEDGAGEKWNIDLPALAERLRQMPYASQAAVCDVVRRFWKHPRLNDLGPVELLREVGARIAT